MHVLHEWKDGTKFYLNDEKEYMLDYAGKSHKISIVRTGVVNMAIAESKQVPKMLLAEIGMYV